MSIQRLKHSKHIIHIFYYLSRKKLENGDFLKRKAKTGNCRRSRLPAAAVLELLAAAAGAGVVAAHF